MREEETVFSGSQAGRQAQVAAQGYIISEALSQAGIPHRVTGYCAFWGYTVLQRFRDYEDPRETNERIFQFRAYANNRDGLALKTVSSSLIMPGSALRDTATRFEFHTASYIIS